MRRPAPTTLFLFAFVSSSSGNLYVTHSQSGGLGAQRLMRSPAPTMLFLFAFCY